MNRARIREIANSVAHSDAMLTDYAGIEKAIESAILRFAEELLTQEPSEGMLREAFNATVWPDLERPIPSNLMHALEGNMRKEFLAMSDQLLKEVKGE